jgi:flagellar protein FlaG
METRIIDNRLASIIQHHAATEPAIPHTRPTGAVANQKPMNPDNPSAGLRRSSAGRTASLPQTVENANQLAQSAQRGITFAVDNDSGQVVVRVTDEKTGELIRQIPSAQFLEMVSRVQEAVGLFFDEVA